MPLSWAKQPVGQWFKPNSILVAQVLFVGALVSSIGDSLCARHAPAPPALVRTSAFGFPVWPASVAGSKLCWLFGRQHPSRIAGGNGFVDQG